jgi:hypothetical protein
LIVEWIRQMFERPVQFTGVGRLAMLLPLALSISVVYKTIRCNRLQTVPSASLYLAVVIVLCMFLIGGALMLCFRLLA